MNGVQVYPHVTGTNTMRSPSVDVTALAQQIAALPVQTMVELAAAIVAANMVTADRFADMLLDAIAPNMPVMMPSERYMTTLVAQTSASDDLSTWSVDDDDVDYDYLPAMAQ